jgi:Flp pilus assembly protein TadD
MDVRRNSHNELVESGHTAFLAGEYERAAGAFEDALKNLSESRERFEVLMRLADAREAAGTYDRALAALKEALEIDADSPAAWNNTGIVCRRIGKLDEARSAFERAYRLDPSNPDILVNLGSIALKMSDPGGAKQHLDRALELNPSHPQAHANLSLVLALFGRIEEAEEELRLAVFHGFSSPEPIQDGIDRMKSVRERILSSREEARTASPDGSDESDGFQ